MKKICLILVSLISLSAGAQVTLEHTYDGYGVIAHLEFQDDKYAILDVDNDRCRLYNDDHSLYKTINLPVPAGYELNSLQYVTDGLFNTDSQIEVSFTYFKNTGSSYIYENRVANEVGQVLVTIPGASSVLVDHFNDSWKYIAWIYDYSSYPYQVETKYYSLPGHMVTTNITECLQSSVQKPFPNPASEFITISYKLGSVNDSRMLISNASGHIVRSINIGPDYDNVMVSVKGLPAGIYFYAIENEGVSGKFVIR